MSCCKWRKIDSGASDRRIGSKFLTKFNPISGVPFQQSYKQIFKILRRITWNARKKTKITTIDIIPSIQWMLDVVDSSNNLKPFQGYFQASFYYRFTVVNTQSSIEF